jgi:hypothetical protein
MAHIYPLSTCGVNPTVVTGRFLAHNHLNPIAHAFLAADLHEGVKLPTELTMTQSAYLARVNVTYAWWAKRRQKERRAIEAGLIPLVPARFSIPKVNGSTLPMVNRVEIADAELLDIARIVGPTRMVDAAIAIEAAQ